MSSKPIEVCMSSLENINTSDQEVKTMDIRSFLSGIEYNLPMKLWMGETTIKYKALVKSMAWSEMSKFCNDDIHTSLQILMKCCCKCNA
jgi:hypothetical protein